MRAGKKPPEGEVQERCLGEIAPLLAAARQLEMLSPIEQRQVRKRVLRTLFGTRSVRLHGRLVPALLAIALLVVGGAAFATAHRLGLLPGWDRPKAEPAAQPLEPPKRKRPHGRPRAALAPAPSPESVVVPESSRIAMPEAPRPLRTLAPSGELPRTGAQGPSATARTAAAAPAPAASVAKPAGRPSARRLVSAPPSATVAHGDRPAPVIPAPPEPAAAPVVPDPRVVAVLAAPPFAQPAAPAIPTPAPALKLPPARVVPPPGPPLVPPPEATKSPLTDQALFGRALRRLRAEHDAAGALAALREHGKAFPESTLAGERRALEVEALLTLQRDREALALLDTMALDELPRSGERLVVRGELRAAARRWRQAQGDFDRALARVSGSPAWHERALWGRAVARLRLGEREAGVADIERYLDTYPKGRFAAEAAKLVPESR